MKRVISLSDIFAGLIFRVGRTPISRSWKTQLRSDHFHRRADGEWLYSLVNNLEGSLRLDIIGFTLKLTDVYDRIVFPVEESDGLSEE